MPDVVTVPRPEASDLNVRKLCDLDDRCLVNPLTDECLTETTDHLLRVPPPEFWQPRQLA